MSIVALGLGLSNLIPGILPVATLFFTIKGEVDRFNLNQGIWVLGIENKGLLTVSVVYYMRLIVAVWWFVMGLVFIGETVCKGAPTWASYLSGWSLVCASGVIVVVGWFRSAKMQGWNRVAQGAWPRRRTASLGRTEGFLARMRRLMQLQEVAPRRGERETLDIEVCNWRAMSNPKVIWPDHVVEGVQKKEMTRRLSVRQSSREALTQLEEEHAKLMELHNRALAGEQLGEQVLVRGAQVDVRKSFGLPAVVELIDMSSAKRRASTSRSAEANFVNDSWSRLLAPRGTVVQPESTLGPPAAHAAITFSAQRAEGSESRALSDFEDDEDEVPLPAMTKILTGTRQLKRVMKSMIERRPAAPSTLEEDDSEQE